jgi:LysR family transcriptional regulator, benzoate and cis,cis-muconate-responsive activator of ben and cat genes
VAAEKLNMAQPPLSRQIQQLEEDLGVTLIDREARPLRLTAVGRVFLEQATQILGKVEGLQELVKGSRHQQRPRFVIGFVASTMYASLPELIRRFRTAAPIVDLSVAEVVSAKQAEALRTGQIDVGFGRIRFEDSDVRRDVLREERLVVAVPLRHSLAKQERPLRLASLCSEPLIIYPRHSCPSYAEQVISLFHNRGLKPNVAHHARELQTAIGLVAAEIGISIVPESVKRLRRDNVVYRDLDDPTLTSPTIMTRRLNDNSPQLALMCKVICDAYPEWGWPAPVGLQDQA